ncbi:PAS domain-containing sensor histidine kinase [Pararhodonellum marinum]|uniref:PAS domain-containing sensor histidine kinase n=1 Tax=Pararhodonellum marinum TaxID=2755358 RepID=UPI00188EA8B0|nr:PAS domain-containing sensor histidine kinase [Pararhodonellum marinum]
MLNKTKKLHFRSFAITTLIVTAVLVLGFLQFHTYPNDPTRSDASRQLQNELSGLSHELRDLENVVLFSEDVSHAARLDHFWELKEVVQNRLSALTYFIDRTSLEKADLNGLETMTNAFFNFHQTFLVERFQSQDESYDFDTFTLSELSIIGFISDLSIKESKAVLDSSFESRKFWEIYFYSSMGLLACLFIIGFIYHKVIKTELESCDEHIFQNKINQEIFEHAERIAGLGHGYINLDQKKIVFSSNLYRIMGYDPLAFPPSLQSYIKHIHKEDRKKVLEALKSLSLTNESVQLNARIVSDSGEMKQVNLLAVLRIENKDRAMILVNQDATSEIEIQNTLKELNQNLSLQNRIFKHVEIIASIGYYAFNPEAESVIFSDNLYRMLGFKPDSFKASKEMFLTYVKEEDRESVSNLLEPNPIVKSKGNAPVQIKTCYGEIKYVSLSRKYFVKEGGKLLLITLKEVTQEVLANKKLELQNKELQRINSELASFNHIASHDLQEPLRKIQTMISMLSGLEELKISKKGKEYFYRIQRSANQMQLLILDLLQFSRLSLTDKIFELNDLNHILRNALDEITLFIEEKKADIQVSELPVAEVIPFQIQQLFKNLLSNAVKFSKPDEPNTIQIFSENPTPEELSQFSNHDEEELIKVVVKDQGIGFDQTYAKSIFVIFNRLHGKLEFPGSGIGLAICKKIIENHDGIISAKSVAGKGATFTFLIPKRRNMAQSEK